MDNDGIRIVDGGGWTLRRFVERTTIMVQVDQFGCT